MSYREKNQHKFRKDIFTGREDHPQCCFFEELPSDSSDNPFYGVLFCHMSGKEHDAEWCKGDYLKCPISAEGKRKIMVEHELQCIENKLKELKQEMVEDERIKERILEEYAEKFA
jgi:hypothetical protein